MKKKALVKALCTSRLCNGKNAPYYKVREVEPTQDGWCALCGHALIINARAKREYPKEEEDDDSG